MAATGEDRIVSELRACRESLGQIRSELSGSVGQFEHQVSGLRESLTQTQESYRDLQARLDQVQENSTQIENQMGAVRNLDARLEQAEAAIQTLESVEFFPPPGPPVEGIDPRMLKNAIRALSEGNSQEDILDGFLEQVSKKVGRAILFANQDGRFIAWRSRGFPEEAVESVVVEDHNDPILAVARNQRMIYREQAPADARPSLGDHGELPHAFVAIPLVFDAYVPVVLYADSDASFDVDYLELLSHLAVLILKNNALQQLVSERPPAEESKVAAVERPAEPAAASEQTSSAAAVDQTLQEMPTAAEVPTPAELPVPEPWEIPESMRDEGHPDRTAAVEEPPSVAQEPATTFEDLDARLDLPVQEPIPSLEPEAELEAGTKPAPAPAPVSSLSPEEDEKFHNEARRFARLLVSEIKLYNEDEVYNGRQNADLYLRLKRDIDRSREMYDKRVHPAVAASADHFHEELIRILAREDSNLMGTGYTGPTLRN